MQDLCLFSHFDKDNKVDEYVLRYLRELKQLQFSIVFISTADLPTREIGRLRGECSDVIVRENTGMDFGSWSVGFAKYEDKLTGRLLLANDSVYGPIGDFTAAFRRLTSGRADFYGFVESIEIAQHIQSWFLLFERAVTKSAEFTDILHRPFSTMTKKEIIQRGEVDLSRNLVERGFKYNASYLSSPGFGARYFSLNPTHILWRELLLEQNVPFLKIELLRDNPLGLEDAETILDAVDSLDPEFSGIIKRHLARVRAEPARRTEASMPRRLLTYCRRALMRNAYRRRHRSADLGQP
jgi:lipopolysaccharide biosynthesis protein